LMAVFLPATAPQKSPLPTGERVRERGVVGD
jgi:hypothetical protein